MHRILLWHIALLSGILLSSPSIVSGDIRTLSSVRQVDGNPYLYTLDYDSPYDLDDLLDKDADEYVELLNYAVARLLGDGRVKLTLPDLGEASVGNCTSFQVPQRDGEGYYFGRNYDYFENPTLVVRSFPANGYASISVCDMSLMGYSLNHVPTSYIQRLNCLLSIYAPLDGINEKGFCGSILALPARFASRQETPNHDLGTSTILRMMLDRCATVDEAIALLETVDVRHDSRVKTGFHYMIADAGGDCAVVEFDPEDNWKTLIVRKSPGRSYMQVTNHMLAPEYLTDGPDETVGNPGSYSWWRYDSVGSFIEEHGGTLDRRQAHDCLTLVRQVGLKTNRGLASGVQYQLKFRGLKPVVEKIPDREKEDTQYSCVYDQKNITLSLRNWNDYDVLHRFSLER